MPSDLQLNSCSNITWPFACSTGELEIVFLLPARSVDNVLTTSQFNTIHCTLIAIHCISVKTKDIGWKGSKSTPNPMKNSSPIFSDNFRLSESSYSPLTQCWMGQLVE